MALKIGEGNERGGKVRSYHFRVAAGSAAEVRAALRVAFAWGEISAAEIQQIIDLLGRILSMLRPTSVSLILHPG